MINSLIIDKWIHNRKMMMNSIKKMNNKKMNMNKMMIYVKYIAKNQK